MLTGAFTRPSGAETLDLQYHIAAMHEAPITVAFVDLDDFKSVNDSFGHDEGDRVLQAMAESLRSCLRRGDALIRWGGEEFLLVLGNTDPLGARLVVQRLREKGFGVRPDGAALTASIGVAERIKDGTLDWPQLVELADKRMYDAKNSGKDRAILPGEETVA